MEYYQEKPRSVPVREKADVLVVGGGPAGIIAAVAAKKTGTEKVLLVERYGFLGGMLTAGSVLNMRTFSDRAGNLVIKGIPYEFISMLKEHGGAYGDPAKDEYVRQYSEVTKYVSEKFCIKYGVRLLYHTVVADAILEESRLKGIIIESKSGREAIYADVIVDATGDADVAAFAGVPFDKEDPMEGMQPMTTAFIMGGASPDTWPVLFTKEAREKYNELYEQGKYPIPRKGLSFFPTHRKGEVYANITRTRGDATNVDDLTRGEIECREQIVRVVEFLRQYMPGYEEAYVIKSAPQIGLRETRRIRGGYSLTREDVLEAREHAHSIARGSYMIDIHHNSDTTEHTYLEPGTSYAIPYECIVPNDVDGLLVAGRCISTTHDAQGSTRCIASCMSTGHAAGTAAAIACSEKTVPRKVSVEKLQNVLRQQDAIL